MLEVGEGFKGLAGEGHCVVDDFVYGLWVVSHEADKNLAREKGDDPLPSVFGQVLLAERGTCW